MAITNRNDLVPGTLMAGKYKKREFFLKATETGFVRIHDDKPDAKEIKSQPVYSSLSAAASNIRGCPTNGLRFWTVLTHKDIVLPKAKRGRQAATHAPEMARAATRRQTRKDQAVAETAEAVAPAKKRGRPKKAA